jgi:hypothetical protein
MKTLMALCSLMLSASWAFACEGPTAMMEILRSEKWGWILFVVNLAVVFLGAILLKLAGWTYNRMVWLGVLILIHPGWWLSARSGDCGASRWIGSIAVSFLSGLSILVMLVIAWRRGRKSTNGGANPCS